MGVSEVRGTLLGSLVEGNPTVRASILGVPDFPLFELVWVGYFIREP